MNNEYLERALEMITEEKHLIIIASRRANELARHYKPLVKVSPEEEHNYLDIALLEIAEGKIVMADGEEK